MNTNIQLTDGVILLRPADGNDIPAILEAVHESLDELHPWLDWATAAYDEAAAQRWLGHVLQGWQHAGSFQFVIIDCSSGRLIGACRLDGVDDQTSRCNLGYWVRTGSAGQGIASRAIRLAAGFAFQTLELACVEIVIAAPNIASQRAAQKAGARCQGSLPKPLLVRTDEYEAVLYHLRPSDIRLSG